MGISRTQIAETDVARVSRSRHLAYSLGLWGSTVAIALCTKKLGVVMALTGNVAGSLLGFLLPGLVVLSPAVKRAAAPGLGDDAAAARSRGRALAEAAPPLFLVAFGVLSCVLGVVTTFMPDPKAKK